MMKKKKEAKYKGNGKNSIYIVNYKNRHQQKEVHNLFVYEVNYPTL